MGAVLPPDPGLNRRGLRHEQSVSACLTCGFESPPGFRFCGGCGGPLASAPAGERRRLTVMFCDLVGSTALSERLDPEELHGLVADYHRTCGEAIQAHGGHVAQLLGDGVLCYFGYPTAHADDARRAVSAALTILERLHGLQARIGLHSGLVVVGELGHAGHREQLALGDTPNIAARLQALAEPGTVVLSGATHRLVEPWFHFEDLGQRELKGLTRPLRVFRVLEPADPEEARMRDPLPLVGREAELELLQAWWREASAGRGGTVLLQSRPGMGRSRLAQEVQDRAWREGGLCLTAFGSPHHGGTSLHPVVDLLERLLGFGRRDSEEERRALLAQRLAHRPEALPFLAALLGLSGGEVPTPELTPQALKARILHHLVQGVLDLARQQPVVLVVEDFEFVDPTTGELLALLAAEAPRLAVLVLLLVEAAVPGLQDVRHLPLRPLPAQDVARLVRALAPGLSEPQVARILERSDGVPVYAQELTRLVVESGDADTIPDTLHGSLMERLDRQADAKEVAQIGATIGRRFAHELIRELTQAGVEPHLVRLVRNELLDRRGVPPLAEYVFQSALLQHAAYESLLKSVRQRHHERIARTLEEKFPEITGSQPEIVAHHYTEGRQLDRAVLYWKRAGDRAMTLFANAEAIRSYSRALELLEELPEDATRAGLELQLRTAIAPALIATRGYASPAVESTYERARELCTQLGDAVDAFPILAGLWVFHLVRGRLGQARELADRLLGLAGDDETLLLLAHTAAGETALWQGRLAEARPHLEAAVVLHDPERHRDLSLTFFGTDPAVGAHAYLSWCLWLTGDVQAARESSRRSRDLAERLRHPHSQAHALAFACWLHLNLGEPGVVASMAERTLELSQEQGFPLWQGVAQVFRGSARGPEGALEVAAGLETLQRTQTQLGASFFMSVLARLQAGSGHPDEALAVLEQTLFLEEGWWEPELHRLRGEILQSVGRYEEAGGAYRRALECGRARGALTLELRAALSLAALCPDETAGVLAPVCERLAGSGLPELSLTQRS